MGTTTQIQHSTNLKTARNRPLKFGILSILYFFWVGAGRLRPRRFEYPKAKSGEASEVDRVSHLEEKTKSGS